MCGDALAGCEVTAAEHEGTTDRTGMVTFEVKDGRTFVSVVPPAGEALRGRSGWQTVRAGTLTEVTIVLLPTANMLFWSRLVAPRSRFRSLAAKMRAATGSALLA